MANHNSMTSTEEIEMQLVVGVAAIATATDDDDDDWSKAWDNLSIDSHEPQLVVENTVTVTADDDASAESDWDKDWDNLSIDSLPPQPRSLKKRKRTTIYSIMGNIIGKQKMVKEGRPGEEQGETLEVILPSNEKEMSSDRSNDPNKKMPFQTDTSREGGDILSVLPEEEQGLASGQTLAIQNNISADANGEGDAAAGIPDVDNNNNNNNDIIIGAEQQHQAIETVQQVLGDTGPVLNQNTAVEASKHEWDKLFGKTLLGVQEKKDPKYWTPTKRVEQKESNEAPADRSKPFLHASADVLKSRKILTFRRMFHSSSKEDNGDLAGVFGEDDDDDEDDSGEELKAIGTGKIAAAVATIEVTDEAFVMSPEVQAGERLDEKYTSSIPAVTTTTITTTRQLDDEEETKEADEELQVVGKEKVVAATAAIAATEAFTSSEVVEKEEEEEESQEEQSIESLDDDDGIATAVSESDPYDDITPDKDDGDEDELNVSHDSTNKGDERGEDKHPDVVVAKVSSDTEDTNANTDANTDANANKPVVTIKMGPRDHYHKKKPCIDCNEKQCAGRGSAKCSKVQFMYQCAGGCCTPAFSSDDILWRHVKGNNGRNGCVPFARTFPTHIALYKRVHFGKFNKHRHTFVLKKSEDLAPASEQKAFAEKMLKQLDEE